MAHFMPPALLALFAPRPPLEWKPPIEKRPPRPLDGIAKFKDAFVPKDQLTPIVKQETAAERKARLREEKHKIHGQVLRERAALWDPKNNPNATGDAYKTLFVARLSYDIDRNDLRDEFERYGPVKDIKIIKDRHTNKPRGYAFVEFESSHDLKDAFRRADGRKLKGRRILVDVERGRTVPDWKPRKLGGGLGGTRIGADSQNRKYSGREDPRSARSETDRYKERRRQYRDRDERDRDRGRSDRDRERRRDRSRDRGDRDRRGDRDDERRRRY